MIENTKLGVEREGGGSGRIWEELETIKYIA